MNNQKGFTLLEVMVAILLMAVVSMIAWRGLDSVTRADAHLRDSSEQTRQLLGALNQLERDVAMRASIELLEPADPDASVEAPSAPSALTVRGGGAKGFRLDVIRASANQDGGLQRVSWWLKDNTLYRAQSTSSSRYPLPAPNGSVEVLNQVSAVQVRIWEDGKGWRSLSGNRQENPAGLEIQLARQTPQGVEHYRQVLGPLN